MRIHNLLAAAACIGLASQVDGAFIIVDNLGGSVIMNSGNVPNVLVPGSLAFTENEMQSVHTMLGGAGIDTDNYVTFLLAETSAGLSFMALVDNNIVPPGGGLMSSLAMSTTGPDTMEPFVNAEGSDLTNWLIPGNGLQTFDTLWYWDSTAEADGFAWGGLAEGDAVTYHFLDTGAAGLNPEPFQFLSFDGGAWNIVATGDFSSAGQFVFSFTTIPAPGALALLALGGLTTTSRRRR